MSAISGGKRRETAPVSFDDGNVSIGDYLTFVDPTAVHSVAAGPLTAIGANCVNCVALGTQATVNASVISAIAMGRAATVTGNRGISLGDGSTAGANAVSIGASVNAPSDLAIHSFSVRGYNGGAINTLAAIDNPVNGALGLSLVYNASGVFSNKTLMAAVAPPVGAMLVYTLP